MKVDYITLDGSRSTAYLDQEMTATPGVWLGQDKYSDKEIFAQWTGMNWIERPHGGTHEA